MTVEDLVKSVVGTQKLPSAEIFLSPGLDGCMVDFRVDRTILYMIEGQDFIDPQSIPYRYAYHQSNPGVEDDNLTRDMSEIHDSIRRCVHQHPFVEAHDLQDDPMFAPLMQLKSDDGLSYYHMYDDNHNKYNIPMYSGFLKINKGDTVDGYIYPYNINCNMNCIVIHKKKLKRDLNCFFFTINTFV